MAKKDNLTTLAFRLKFRKTIKQHPSDLIHVCFEECRKEIERRNKQ